MEQKIMEVLRRMQPVLNEDELRELKSALQITFSGCDIVSRQSYSA